IGVLALGRAMSGEISAKHCIKRVWRFLRNEQLETEAVFRAMFRDLKNRDWGLGLDHVRLTQPQRHDRHFAVIALAYVLLAAFGAIAEKLKIDRQLKANTRKDRVMNLARIGNYFLQIYYCPLENAFYALLQLPT
ncbi:MAG: hypothetical protein K1Y02_05275, partial [Candidatus Hydrogenedentes bacterium]|nr:hypothetical protein [Candidatus Hydrogenedentota bacterium]